MPELILEGKTLEKVKSSTFNEALRILAVAETFERHAEQRTAEVVRYDFAIQLIVAIATIGLLILPALQNANLYPQVAIWGFTAAIYAQVAWTIYCCWRLRAKAALARDEDLRLMQRLIDLLREIEGAFALDEEVSVLDRVGLQTRLMRYGIGPGVRGSGTSSPNS
jgi:hypothetical protein